MMPLMGQFYVFHATPMHRARVHVLLHRVRRARQQREARVDRVQMRHRRPSEMLSEAGKGGERYRGGDRARE